MCLRRLGQEYRAVGPYVRRQFKWTVAVWVFIATTTVVFADDPQNPVTRATDLITIPNMIVFVTLIYGAGILREQFAETRSRIAALEKAFEKAMNETIPETYVRKDVYEAKG